MREPASRRVMGRGAVCLTAGGLGLVGVVSLSGVTVSRSLDQATDGAMLVDFAWSVLLILGAVLVLLARAATRRLPDPEQGAVMLERVGSLLIAVGIAVFLGGVLIAIGLSGALMTLVALTTQTLNVISRQVALSPVLVGLLRRGRTAVQTLRGRA